VLTIPITQLHSLKFPPPGEIIGTAAKKTGPPPGELYRDKFRPGADMFFAGAVF